MSEFKENIDNIADEFLKAKSFFKEKVFDKFGFSDMANKLTASNLTLAYFTHLKNEKSEEKCAKDVNDVFSSFLQSLNSSGEGAKGLKNMD